MNFLCNVLPSLKVLVVEDNFVNQKLMEKILTADGHSVVIAENGQKAHVEAQSNKFDVILMDIQMPVMGGLESAEKILTESVNSTTPIIAVTADLTLKSQKLCAESGMKGFVAKPFRRDDLFREIATIVFQATI